MTKPLGDLKNFQSNNIPSGHRGKKKKKKKSNSAISTKHIIHHEEIGFIKGMLAWFNIQELINVINDIIE